MIITAEGWEKIYKQFTVECVSYFVYVQAREEQLSVTQTVRTEARMQAKVTKSILDCVHDSPADILPGPAPLPPCQIKLGMFIYVTK